MGTLSRRSKHLPDVDNLNEATYRRTGRRSFFDTYAVCLNGREPCIDIHRVSGSADVGDRLMGHVVSELKRLGYPECGELRWL